MPGSLDPLECPASELTTIMYLACLPQQRDRTNLPIVRAEVTPDVARGRLPGRRLAGPAEDVYVEAHALACISRRRDCHSAAPPFCLKWMFLVEVGRGCQQNGSLADG